MASSKCPVCMEEIFEPVVFPCRHEVCKDCFKRCVELANMHCPFCRRRLSSWARKNAKDPVSKERKKEIDEKRTLLMLKDDVEARLDTVISLSQPGDIRQEYLQELQKVVEERKDVEEEGEREATKMHLEEQLLWEQRQGELKKLELEDEAMARSLEGKELTREQEILQQLKDDEEMAHHMLELVESASNPSSSVKKQGSKKHRGIEASSSKPITHWFKPVQSETLSSGYD